MRIHHNSGILILLGLSFIFASTFYFGCSGKNPNVNWTPMEMSEFEQHLTTLQARYDLTETLKSTEMMVTIQEAGHRSEELRELLWYKKTADGNELLRINVLGAFNDTKGLAIANREQFLLTLLDEQKTYVGELNDGILGEIFGVDLRVSDVLSAIFANPFLDGRNTSFTKIEKYGQLIRVTRPGIENNSVETIILKIQEDEPHVTEWQIKNNKRLLQRVLFDDYRDIDGILRANKVEITRPPEQTRVVVRMEQVQMNVEIKDSKFDFAPFLSDDFEVITISNNDETDGQE